MTSIAEGYATYSEVEAYRLGHCNYIDVYSTQIDPEEVPCLVVVGLSKAELEDILETARSANGKA